MKQLFYNKGLNQYFLLSSIDDPLVYCSGCNKNIEIDSYVFMQRSWSHKEFKKEIFCRECVQKRKQRIFDEFLVVLVAEDVPEDSLPIVDTPPSVTPRKETDIFNLAVQDIKGCKVNDHTIYAGKESLEGAKIGADMSSRIEQLDSEIKTLNEADNLLSALQNSQAVIEGGEKQRIEKKPANP